MNPKYYECTVCVSLNCKWCATDSYSLLFSSQSHDSCSIIKIKVHRYFITFYTHKKIIKILVKYIVLVNICWICVASRFSVRIQSFHHMIRWTTAKCTSSAGGIFIVCLGRPITCSTVGWKQSRSVKLVNGKKILDVRNQNTKISLIVKLLFNFLFDFQFCYSFFFIYEDQYAGQRSAPAQAAAPSAWGNQRSQPSNAPPSNANRSGSLIYYC